MQKSIFVIFELSDGNPNVTFELGFAIGIAKNYFILKSKKRRRKLPADIDQIDRIDYESLSELRRKLADRINRRYLTS